MNGIVPDELTGLRSDESKRPSRRLIDELVRAAVAAPSMHNTQPWRFRIQDAGSTIELHLDPARMLPVGDPDGRAVHIACGAALLNVRVAVADAGLRPDIRLLPSSDQSLLLAEIRLGGRHHPTRWERELHAAIWRRQTNREPFSNRLVPPGIRAELAEAACLEGATLAFLDRDEAERVLRLAAEAERDLLATRPTAPSWPAGLGATVIVTASPAAHWDPGPRKAAIRSATSPPNGARRRCGTPGSRSTRNWPRCRPAPTVRWPGWRPARPCSGSG